jgi:AcrR family transcriptional regulator
MARGYELKQRALQMEDTRQRIVEAAIDLHATVGPARTTVSAIAERAGVQRQTYYRHFPDERSLNNACSGLYVARNPLPDPSAWDEIADPGERLRHGLSELYAYFAANEAMLAHVIRDAEVHPVTREAMGRLVAPDLERIRGKLTAALYPTRQRPSKSVRAAVALVADFASWKSLVRHAGLSQREAVDAAARMLRGVAGCRHS